MAGCFLKVVNNYTQPTMPNMNNYHLTYPTSLTDAKKLINHRHKNHILFCDYTSLEEGSVSSDLEGCGDQAKTALAYGY